MAAADPRIPHQRRDPQFRQRRRGRALQPGRRGHARPHHPHQELAADRARARGGKLDDFKRARAQAAAQTSSSTTRPISRATTRASAAPRRMLDPLPRVVLVPGLGLFGLGRSQEGRARSPPISREAAVEAITDAEAIGRFEVDLRSRHVRHANIGRSSRPSSAAAKEAARRPGRGHHRRRRRDRRRDREGLRGGRRRGRAARCRRRPRRRTRRKAIGGAALAVHCDVTDAASVRAAFDQVVGDLRRRRHRGVECRRGLAGPHRRGRRGDAAQELRTEFLRPPARGAGRGEDHAGAGHRRLPAVQRLEAGGQSGTEFRALRPAEGGDAVPGAAIRARLRRRRHPRQRASTPTASARACSPTISSPSAPRRAA